MKHTAFNNTILASFLLALSTLLLQGQAVAAAPADAIPVDITGELTVLYADDFKNKRAELQYFIEDKQSNRRYRLQFDGTPPGHMRTGATVKVRGKAKGKAVYLDADGVDSSNDPVAPATLAVAGEQKTLVMVANFNDADVSCPVDEIRDLMFTDAADQSVDDLYQETSYGGIWLNGQVMGPYNLSYSSTTCDYTAWGQAVDEAVRGSGVEPNAYDRKVYVFPQNGCPSAGIGTVGGNPSRSWIFYCNIADIFGHELGHNLGMHHASTPGSEYGDNSDIMGIGQNRLRQINAPHKEQMGWLSGLQIDTVNQSGYYDIAPLELEAAGALAPQALKIAKPDTNEYYYLSYRRGIGFDANLSASQYLDRLSVHRYPGDGSSSKTYLLALPVDGESFTDPVNGITVTQVSHNNDYVTIEVSLDGSDPGPSCIAGIPQLNFSPPSQSATAGSTLDYSVSVTNADSDACVQSTFTLSPVNPSGWAVTLSPSTLSLGPGQTGSATFSVTSPEAVTAAAYGVGVNVTDSSEAAHAATAAADYVVVDGCTPGTPTMTVSPASQSGSAGSTLAYAVDITNTDDSACASGTFSMGYSVPSGWTGSVSPSSLSLAPGQSGQATLYATSPSGAAGGSYSVNLNISDMNVAGHGNSGNATYTVQVTTDTVPPSAPGSLSASAKRKQVNLSWNASTDNVGVTGYRVLRDGVMLTNTQDTSYNDRGITAGVTYSYQVVAYDAKANVSDASNSASVTIGGGGSSGGGGGKGRKK